MRDYRKHIGKVTNRTDNDEKKFAWWMNCEI
jgi:hypothetical protein